MGRNYWLLSSLCLLKLAVFQQQLKAEVIPTADATGTIVDVENNQFNISGGTRIGDNLFHRFDSLNLDAEEIATFLNEPNIELILGQISNSDPSYIDGLLQVSSSGTDLYLLNPSGILFGPNARLNVSGSFTATTADRVLFEAGTLDVLGTVDYAHLTEGPHSLIFSSGKPSSIVNQGQLSVPTGQSLRLIGGQVLTTGTLTAPSGEITIAAVGGESRVRISQANQLLSLDLTVAPTAHTLATEQVTPTALPELLTGGDQSSANQFITHADGSLSLAGSDISPTAGNSISVAMPLAIASGQLDTTGKIGGQINVLGQQVGILDADIDVSGNQGGGSIRIGVNTGEQGQDEGSIPNATTTVVDAQSILQANAHNTGNGGQITVWADHTTRFFGTASARGGTAAGNGGHIETSGREYLDITDSSIDASAANGDAGIWLLDPTDIEIVDGAGGIPAGGVFSPASTGISSQISPDTIEAALDSGTSVEITTSNGTGENGDITLTNSINQTGNGNAALILTGRQFFQSGSAEINLTSTGGLTFNLNQINPETTTTTTSIQAAIDAIGDVTGDRIINLGAGTYLTQGTPVVIDRDVIIAGESRDNTLLSGENNSRIFEITTAATTTLQDLRITAGANTSNQSGGGVYNQGNLSLLNTQLSNNHAQLDGGAIFNEGQLTLTDSQLSNNTADRAGGGLANHQGVVNINTSEVISNQAANGGGIENFGGTLALINSQVTTNTTTAPPANNNSAVEVSQGGGGIRNRDGGRLTVTQSEISNNFATRLGGGILNVADSQVTATTIVDSTLNNNVADARGGGVQTSFISTGNEGTSLLEITNSTISGNQAGDTGGGVRTVGNTTLTNVTIANNTVVNGSGGGFSARPNAASPTLTNTLIAGNTASSAPDVDGAFDDQGNNLIGISDGSIGLSQSTLVGDIAAPIDPRLAPLGNYGGITLTHALLPGSDAIDAGNNSVAPASDQRGVARANSIAADIGAFESTGYTLQTTSGSGQSTEVRTAFDDPLQVTLTEDAFNTPLPGANIEFSSPQTGASTTLATTQRVTDVDGQALTLVTANEIAGNYTVDASSGNLSTQFNLTNVSDPPYSEPAPVPVSPSNPTLEASPATDPTWQWVTQPPNSGLDADEAGMTLKLHTNSAADLALQELDRSISSDYGAYYDGLSTRGTSITEIQQTLRQVHNDRGEKSAIVYAIFTPKAETHSANPDLVSASLDTLKRSEEAKTDDQLELILITETEDPIRYMTNATRAEVVELAKYYRMAISDPEDFSGFKALSQQFYQWLLSPLETDLKRQTISSLVYTLDEGLRTIPLAAMMDRDDYAIDRYALSIIPSFGLTEHSLVWLQNQTTLATGADTFQTLAPLPAVESELAWVQSQLGGGRSLFNETFTVDNLLNTQSSQNPGVLHVATHAQFNPGQPHNSFIQFWDEQLSLDEVRSLNWQNSSLELLILSACTTALGDRNAELGFAGIATASGVRSALGSLWFISDIGTVALMGEFYAQLETSQTISEALQQTQQALISGQVRLENGYLITSTGKIPMPDDLNLPDYFIFNHPYYWSAFTLIGNPW